MAEWVYALFILQGSQMFKPKSPLGKENSRMGIFMNDYEKAGNHYPNPPSPFSQTLLKTKKLREQPHPQPENHYPPAFNRHKTLELDLECDEILEELHQQPKKRSLQQEEQERTLFCEEELEIEKTNDWNNVMMRRMEKVLRAYQERTETLERENSLLKEELMKERQGHYYHKKQF